MATESFTIEQYHALRNAIAAGSLSVEYGDKKVTYRSLADMERILALIGGELGLISPFRSKGRRVAVHSKDWGGYKPEGGVKNFDLD